MHAQKQTNARHHTGAQIPARAHTDIARRASSPKHLGIAFKVPPLAGAFWFPAMEEGTHFAFPLRVHRFEFSVHMGDKMARLVICCVDSCNSLPPRPTPDSPPP